MTPPIRARLGSAIEAQLSAAGGNTSAALRAYVLLGIAASGQSMEPFKREIARSLAEDLAPELLAALDRLSRPTSVGQVSYIPAPVAADSAPDLAMSLDDYPDPFLDGLVEV